jgi:hypothetical protein
MIDFNNQQIRDSIGPVRSKDTDYTGRMRDIKKCSAGGYEINGKEFFAPKIPADIQNEVQTITNVMDYEIVELPSYGWKPVDEPLFESSLSIPEERLCMCIKNTDLPTFKTAAFERNGIKAVTNDTNIVWAYRENGKTFISTTQLGYATPKEYDEVYHETAENDDKIKKAAQYAIQNGGYLP